MSVPDNPFNRLRARWLFTYALTSFFVSAIITSIIWPTWVEGKDAALPNAFGQVLWYALLLLLLLWAGRRANLEWVKLFGATPTPERLVRITTLAIPLIGISAGSFYLVFHPLSYVAPTWVEAVLRWNWELGSQLTPGPGEHRATIFALNIVLLLVLAPVTEELFCRGYLIHRWALKWGIRKGILLSSVLFALLHLEHFFGILVVGLVLSVLYLETKSLVAAIVVHSTNNLFVLVALMLESSLSGTVAPPTIAEFRSQWWVGVLGLSVGVPWVVRFWRRRANRLTTPLPYPQ